MIATYITREVLVEGLEKRTRMFNMKFLASTSKLEAWKTLSRVKFTPGIVIQVRLKR